MKNILSVILILISISYSAASTLKMRKIASEDCDLNKLNAELKNSVQSYNDQFKQGRLSLEETRFLIKGASDLKELKMVACGHVKTESRKENVCQSMSYDLKKWKSMLSNGSISQNEYDFLVKSQADLNAFLKQTHEDCK